MNHFLAERLREGVIFHIPHAKTAISFLSGYTVSRDRLDQEIERLTDWDTDKIFNVPGTTRVIFPWSRVFCDVERFLIAESMEANGMGFYYTKCIDGSPLRDHNEEAYKLALKHYNQHHRELRSDISLMLRELGFCYIVDCHSFPDEPFPWEEAGPRPDICLGVHPTNTPQFLVDYWRIFFISKGYSVTVNWPYRGSMLPPCFEGNKAVTTIMIEINRKLYRGVMGGVSKLNQEINEAMQFEGLR